MWSNHNTYTNEVVHLSGTGCTGFRVYGLQALCGCTVTLLEAQDAHEPTIDIQTIPSENPRNCTSPPSACTFGITCREVLGLVVVWRGYKSRESSLTRCLLVQSRDVDTEESTAQCSHLITRAHASALKHTQAHTPTHTKPFRREAE
jgi:hypothetical protein